MAATVPMDSSLQTSQKVGPLAGVPVGSFNPNDTQNLKPLSDARIMMVDDEPTTIEFVQMFLEDAGYSQFVTTEDSSEALEMMRHSSPDVVFLDLMMPGVDGFDILSANARWSGSWDGTPSLGYRVDSMPFA